MLGHSDIILKATDPDAFILTFDMRESQNLTFPLYNTTGHDFTIYWGDGTANEITAYLSPDLNHTYSNPGIYTVTIKGICKGVYFINHKNKLNLIKIKQWGNVGMTHLIAAFSGCANLVMNADFTKLANTITEISDNAFSLCTGVFGELVLPDFITRIGLGAFSGTSLIGNLLIPETITDIGSSAFRNCSLITSITLPSTINEIKSQTFESCLSLSILNLHDNTNTIQASAFRYCSGLTGILNLPSSLTFIGSNAFESCSGLTGINFKSNITDIYYYAFGYCTGLSNTIILPESVENIGNHAFRGCNNSTLIFWLESNTPPILGGSSVFYQTSSLMRIKVPFESVDTYKNASYWSTYATKIISQ